MRERILYLAIICILVSKSAFAVIYTVTDAADTDTVGTLRYAINQLNLTGATTGGSPATDNAINIDSGLTITLTDHLPVIQKGVTITGAGIGDTIDGTTNYRIFATYQASLKLDNLTLNQGRALGGAGSTNSGAGGGGLGAGGGVYIAPGQTLDITFTQINNCLAQGGAGATGSSAIDVTNSAGGGGGASFTINESNKDASSQEGGGDNPGSTNVGGNAIPGFSTGYGGGAGGNSLQNTGGTGGGNGVGGNVSTTAAGNGGSFGGGGGAGDGLASAGGGGNGGGSGATDNSGDGAGGGGGYGSGGAGAFSSVNPATFNGGGGGGGFGGGGGGSLFNSNVSGTSAAGGGGGWGGGGGAGSVNGGSGGYYGGNGGASDPVTGLGGGGGGGGAAGGAIFVAGALRIGDSVSMSSNTLTAGLGGAGAGTSNNGGNGSTLGPDVLLFQSATATFYGDNNQTISFGLYGDPLAPAANIDGGIIINLNVPASAITLSNTANSYRGPTTVTAGTLKGGALNVFGSTSALVMANTATAIFDLNGFNQTVGSLSGGGGSGGNIALGANTLTVNQYVAGTYSGAFSGTGGLTLSSASTSALTLQAIGYSGATTINGGTLIFNGVANTTSAIQINSGGTLTISTPSSTSQSITNMGTLNLVADLNVAISTNITSSGGGAVNVSGNRNIGAGDYISSGATNLTITTVGVNDSLTGTGNIILNNGTVNITSNYDASFTTTNTWTLIEAPSISHSATVVNVPDTLFDSWSHNNFAGNKLILTYSRGDLTVAANEGVNMQIATAINAMPGTTPDQVTLLNAFFTSQSRTDFNNDLQQMLPNLNAVAPNIAVQNAVFTKVETRMTTVRDDTISSFVSGLNAGDVCPDTAVWLGAFGSKARQQVIGDNPGYRSNSYGLILGVDTDRHRGGVYGFGLAYSRTLVHQSTYNDVVTAVDGYHALMYGSMPFRRNTFFEWIVNAGFNNYSGSRAINVNGVVMSTNSTYNGAQAGGRINMGKHYYLPNTSRISPLLMLQYFVTYQPSYDESNSPAALHVQPLHFQNILTFGGGARYSFPATEQWMIDITELRALVTYDVLTSDNTVSSNFLLGSSSFVVATTPKRWALRLGADVGFAITKRSNVQFSYDLELRKEYYDNAILLKVAYLF